MRLGHVRTAAICLASAATTIVVTQESTAQVNYVVADLIDLGSISRNKDDYLSINIHGEVVGSYQVAGDRHGFVWLPAANYGLAQGLHDLHSLGIEQGQLSIGLTQDDSVAYDINNMGVIAGWTGDFFEIVEDQGEAIIWQLANPAPVYRLGFYKHLDPEEIEHAWSVAFAVNDDDPPVVVGDMLTDWHTICWDYHSQGFRTEFDLSGPVPSFELVPLTFLSDDNGSYARDVANTPYQGVAQVVGMSSYVPAATWCSISTCQWETRAMEWPPDELPTAPLISQGTGGHHAKGISNDGRIVGWGNLNPVMPCASRALYWREETASPYNLGGIMPPGQEADESRAESITPYRTPPRVVGWNQTRLRALLWKYVSDPLRSVWTVSDLTDEIGSCAQNVVISEGHDISDYGWIVCLADYDTGPGVDYHAVVLTPVETCRWDIYPPGEPDGVVNIFDWFELLFTQFGPCPPSDFCPADFNCDGEVGQFDSDELVRHFGPCDGESAVEGWEGYAEVCGCIDLVGYDDLALLELCICASYPDVCQD